MHDQTEAKTQAVSIADAMNDSDLRYILARGITVANLNHIRRVCRNQEESPILVLNRILDGSRKLWDRMEKQRGGQS